MIYVLSIIAKKLNVWSVCFCIHCENIIVVILLLCSITFARVRVVFTDVCVWDSMEYLVPPKDFFGLQLENGSWTDMMGMLNRKLRGALVRQRLPSRLLDAVN